ncbi:MAG: molybdopterin-dependent oxidoreductase [Thermaceae bacterium]|nr:molybdopterin-dependent oxidoreductase [Thermaceae bacterium]
MRWGDWIWGAAAGGILGAVGLALRGLGVGWPLEGLFAQIAYWLGVPATFNLIHKLFGFGDLAKNLAFIGTALLWLFIHPFLMAGLRRWFWAGLTVAFLFYGAFGGWLLGLSSEGWWAAAIYGLLLGALAWAVRSKARRPAPPTNSARRESLKTLAVLSLGWGVWLSLRAQAQQAVRIIWSKIAGLSPEQTAQKDLYYVSKNVEFLDPRLQGPAYRLEIGGLVDKSLSLNLEEIKALPAVERVSVLTCISNEVGGPLIGNPKWRGVPLQTLLERAGVKSEARFLVWEAADRYVESIPIAEVPPEALLAYAIENPATGKLEDLESKHGYPTRLLLPGRYGMKQPKWLTKITLSANEVPGYWAQRGWSRDAIIRTMNRIDTPTDRAQLKAGEETWIAGVAYAGGRALEHVEVSTDGGKTWQRAILKPPQSKYAWQLWALRWKPAAGNYNLWVRAVEVGGKLQDPTPRDPLPDGATGYHRISVRVV